jgi:hypothetical protein
MENKKKQKLEEVKVQSFVTTLDSGDQKEVIGGGDTTIPGTDPIVCAPGTDHIVC